MRTIIAGILVALTLFTFAAAAFADSYVRGYTRKDGTYVAPHWRSSPDRSYNNNWSVKPNVNPYTGKQGTRSPTWDSRPPQSNTLGNPSYNPYSTRRY